MPDPLLNSIQFTLNSRSTFDILLQWMGSLAPHELRGLKELNQLTRNPLSPEDGYVELEDKNTLKQKIEGFMRDTGIPLWEADKHRIRPNLQEFIDVAINTDNGSVSINANQAQAVYRSPNPYEPPSL